MPALIPEVDEGRNGLFIEALEREVPASKQKGWCNGDLRRGQEGAVGVNTVRRVGGSKAASGIYKGQAAGYHFVAEGSEETRAGCVIMRRPARPLGEAAINLLDRDDERGSWDAVGTCRFFP